MDLVIFTIVSRNYLAYALTLMQSVAEHHPDSKRYLCLADVRADDPLLGTDLFETVTIDQLSLPDFDAFVFRYDIMELNTAVKPYMFEWLRRRQPQAGLVYLDPDIFVVRRLADIEQSLADGKLLVLTPHLNAPLPDDGGFPSELSLMRTGVYNCGFVAINAAHVSASALIRWWAHKLEFGCLVDLEAGLFTDQKWMDMAPGLYPDVSILRHDGYNVAYWNMACRTVTRTEDGIYFVNDVPLVFVHFSGVDLANSKIFSKHQDRFTIDNIGDLRWVYEDYLKRLRGNGQTRQSKHQYAYGSFADGERIAPVLRRVYRNYFDVHCEQPVGKPLNMDRELFNQPCRELADDPAMPVSRVMYEAWRMRKDLQTVFNLYSRDGREGFVRWFLVNAQSDMGLSRRYIDPIQSQVQAALDRQAVFRSATSNGWRGRAAGVVLRMLSWGKRHAGLAGLYARLPQAWRMALRRRAHLYAGLPMPPALSADPPRGPVYRLNVHGENKKGVNLIGYARGEFGVAENVRSYARALESVNCPFIIHNFDAGVASRQQDRSMERHFSDSFPYGTNIFFINADQMGVARKVLGPMAFSGRYNIGFWVWELERFPQAWNGAFKLIDEVWVPTNFIRLAIAAGTDKPVLRMPKAIEFDPPLNMSRDHFGLYNDDFIFLYSYDFNSFEARKNPGAVVSAFREAFSDGQKNVKLLVKSTNGRRYPERLAALANSVAGDKRIEVRDGFLSRQEMFGLQNCVDAYVSLHRAEGFGLGMAECMFLGKPVIATGYSGNLDFMNKENSFLVDYRLIPVREGDYPHWQGQHWADPDIGQAAQLMRRVFDDRNLACKIGHKAMESVRRTNARAVCAAAVTSRLEAIGLQTVSA